jgi:hypothetical protein
MGASSHPKIEGYVCGIEAYVSTVQDKIQEPEAYSKSAADSILGRGEFLEQGVTVNA